jgi:hypothetical protein
MCSKTIVRLLGFILMVAGVIVIIMGVTVVTGSSWISDLMPIEEGNESAEAFAADAAGLGNAFEALIFVFGIYMFIMGVMACWFCGNKCEGKCCAVIVFQVFQLGLIAVTIVVAVMPFAFWMISEEEMTTWCNTSAEAQKIEYGWNDSTQTYAEEASSFAPMLVLGREYVAEADGTILARDELMCTSSCPCDVQNFDLWTAVDDSVKRDWKNEDGGVEDWEDCAELIGQSNSGASGAIASYFDGILKTLEDEFDCQGICEKGNFWLFKDVEDGPVTRTCLISLK